jgi:hypothetical protein
MQVKVRMHQARNRQEGARAAADIQKGRHAAQVHDAQGLFGDERLALRHELGIGLRGFGGDIAGRAEDVGPEPGQFRGGPVGEEADAFSRSR